MSARKEKVRELESHIVSGSSIRDSNILCSGLGQRSSCGRAMVAAKTPKTLAKALVFGPKRAVNNWYISGWR